MNRSILIFTALIAFASCKKAESAKDSLITIIKQDSLMALTEADYRKYMLEEYTFLKRPFIIYDEHVWIGNAKKDVDSAVAFFEKL